MQNPLGLLYRINLKIQLYNYYILTLLMQIMSSLYQSKSYHDK